MNLETATLEELELEPENALELIALNNDKKFNLTKLAEELFELGEVVTKMVNKGEEKAPGNEKFIEEAGDVMLRITMAGISRMGSLELFGELVGKRIEDKMNSLFQNVVAGKYPNFI